MLGTRKSGGDISVTEVTFFESSSEFRKWLDANHDKTKELQVGFYKKNSGKTGITYAQAVNEALCFGWIDGVTNRIDEISYTIRFTPRKSSSIWSDVNIKRVGELTKLGLMQPSGLKAYNERDPEKSKQYSFEQENCRLDGIYEKTFQANKKAWDFFQAQTPSYQKVATWWVISAKKEETRLKRLVKLIENSEEGQKLANVTYKPKT